MGDMEAKAKEKTATVLYWQRWYILLLFSIFTMWSCAVWNTFSPVAASAKEVFGWTDSTITLFTLWGTLDFPLFFFPSALLLKKIYSCHYLVRSLGPFVWLWARPLDVFLFSFQ